MWLRLRFLIVRVVKKIDTFDVSNISKVITIIRVLSCLIALSFKNLCFKNFDKRWWGDCFDLYGLAGVVVLVN